MTQKEFASRIVHKHDIETNWNKATTFIPKQGEMIVYDIDDLHDYERIKIGDGVTAVTELPFYQENVAYINASDNEIITDVETSSSGTSIDVTAKVGQTIAVKSVDENGKPTAWEAVDLQSDWNAGEDEAGHVLNRTHYKDLKTGDLFPTQEINIDELGAGTHLIFESSNNAHFTKTFTYDTVKYRRANTKGASAVGFELGGIIYVDKGVEKTATIGNLDYYTDQLELIDSKNYKFKCVGLFTKSQIFVVVDVKTLTAEYQALFPKVGVYIQIPENDSSYGMTNRRYLFQVYFYKHMSAVYMPLDSARTADVIPTPSSAEVGQTIAVKSVDENGKPTEWEAVDFPENGSAQSDWNQNDPTAPDYVKNRLAWTDDPVETVLLEETELTFVDGGAEFPTPIQLTEGQTYVVIYNGNVYNCTAWLWGAEEIVFIGNGGIFGMSVENDKPFITNGAVIISINADTSATVKIIEAASEVHKIDEKYLPEQTHYDNRTMLVDYDGNYEDIIFDADGNEAFYYLTSDTFTIEDLIGKKMDFIEFGERDSATIMSNWIEDINGDGTLITVDGGTVIICNTENIVFNDIAFPYKGLYVISPDYYGNDYALQIYEGSYKQLDKKYLPDSVLAAQTNAQTMAENAQTTAENAQTMAENAQTTAENAQTTAENALNNTEWKQVGIIPYGSSGSSYEFTVQKFKEILIIGQITGGRTTGPIKMSFNGYRTDAVFAHVDCDTTSSIVSRLEYFGDYQAINTYSIRQSVYNGQTASYDHFDINNSQCISFSPNYVLDSNTLTVSFDYGETSNRIVIYAR